MTDEDFAALVEFMRQHDEVRQAFIRAGDALAELAKWIDENPIDVVTP